MSNVKKNIDDLLIENKKNIIIKDKEEYFSNKNLTIGKKEKEFLPMINLTNFLTQLRLRKFKEVYLKIKNKIESSYKNANEDGIFYSKNPHKDFQLVLHLLLPAYLTRYFPKWFVWLSSYLVKSKHKWVSYFGLERDVYQIILNAKSYEKYGPKNIKVIPHGAIFTVHYWHLFRFSLFPDMKLNIFNEILDLPKTSRLNFSKDILFCPMPFPFVCDSFSIVHFWKFMEIYRKVIKLLNESLKDNKRIKIRYKNFKYLSGFAGPFINEESKIPVESKRFEEVYDKYKLIVSMPFSTISAKCYQNNLDCITYNYPFFLTDKHSYLKANTFPGVFADGNKFLYELKKKINKL